MLPFSGTLQEHILPGEKENHLQKCLSMGYVSSQEGKLTWYKPPSQFWVSATIPPDKAEKLLLKFKLTEVPEVIPSVARLAGKAPPL